VLTDIKLSRLFEAMEIEKEYSREILTIISKSESVDVSQRELMTGLGLWNSGANTTAIEKYKGHLLHLEDLGFIKIVNDRGGNLGIEYPADKVNSPNPSISDSVSYRITAEGRNELKKGKGPKFTVVD